MKVKNFVLTRYDADDGFVFDWAEERWIENEHGEAIQEHLFVKTVFIGENDDISNYIEVPTPISG